MTADETKSLLSLAYKIANNEVGDPSKVGPRPIVATKACPKCKGSGYLNEFAYTQHGVCLRKGCEQGQVIATTEGRKAMRAWKVARRLSHIETLGKRMTAALAMTESVQSRRGLRYRREWTARREALRADYRGIVAGLAA